MQILFVSLNIHERQGPCETFLSLPYTSRTGGEDGGESGGGGGGGFVSGR